MKHLKNYNTFESIIPWLEVNLGNFKGVDYKSENYFINNIGDMLLELKDDGFLVDIRLSRINPVEYEIRISKPGYNRNLIFWSEVKDEIIRLTEYSYNNDYSVRFWADGVEWIPKIEDPMIGFKKEDDFKGISDSITQFSIRILLKKI